MPFGPEPDVNLTPLVDVMLTVLVLVLLTSPLVMEGPDVNLPQAPADEVPLGDMTLVATVTAEGRVYYAERDVTHDLEKVLASDPVLRRERRLYVRGDREATFGAVSRVLTAARSSGVRGIHLVIAPELIAETEAE